MKKRKVPHIILRFSKHVGAAQTFSPDHANSTKGLSAAVTANKEMARESVLGDAAMRTNKRNGAAPIMSPEHDYEGRRGGEGRGGRTGDPNGLGSHVETTEDGQSPGKRKRGTDGDDAPDIVQGKGPLHVPLKKHKKSAAPEKHAGRASFQEARGRRGEDKRVLRSQDTKLSEYAEWLEPEDEDAVDPNSPIAIVEGDLPRSALNGVEHSVGPGGNGMADLATAPNAVEAPGHASILSHSSIPITTIDLQAEVRAGKSRAITFSAGDPLDEERFFKPHQTKVREEKRQRNLERERVVFQKSQYEKKLMSLRSGEWMKAFGLAALIASGMPVDKKALERRRAAMIRDLEVMLFKYNACKEEEKRRRVARGGRSSGSPANSTMEVETRRSPTEDYEVPIDDEDDDEQDTDHSGGPDGEADYQPNGLKKRRQKPKLPKPKRGRPRTTGVSEKPFTSFYKNPNDRNAAVKGWRRAGRNLTAFGRPVPELESREFNLPQDILGGALRQRRARRRASR